MAIKRLIVLSDGTWQTLRNLHETNILRLALGILREDDDGVQQVICYDAGIGTEENDEVDKIFGGAFGFGIDKNIKELYTFLAMNYDEGDEIYLFGFSRGAYTVRSLAGMINVSGLVRREKVKMVHKAYEHYRENNSREDVAGFREENGETVPIKLLTCFDTVGALGVPGVGRVLGMFRQNWYDFHDTTLGAHIQNAIHCVSIDEDRKSFQPTLMDKHPEHGKTQVTQKYFSGGHGGVGCGDGAELLCSDITLRFVLEEIERRGLKLAFDPSKVPSMPDVTTEGDPITRSFPKNVFFWALGKHIRPIQAIEDIHETAIVRYQNVKKWRPQALNPFQKTLSNKITDTQSSHQKNALSQAVKS